MPFCYYCGNKVGNSDVFCRECGKRVVSAVVVESATEHPAVNSAQRRKAEPKKMTDPKKKAKLKEMTEPKKVAPEEKPLTHKVYVSGDIHPGIFTDKCRVTFTEGNGDVLYKAEGKRETVSGGILFEDYSKTVYLIDDRKGFNVAEVEFRPATNTDDHDRTEFRKRLTPKRLKKGADRETSRSRWTELEEFDSRDFSPEPDYFGLSLVTNKHVMTDYLYEAESEGKLFSFVPARTDVTFKRAHVASIEPEGESYRIDYEAPEHVLEAVMIFLALYVRL